MAIGEYLDNDNPDGSVFGRAAGKIGFYGLATPIVKPALTPAVTTVAATSTTPFGFTTAAQADHIVELLNLIRTRLIALGLMSES